MGCMEQPNIGAAHDWRGKWIVGKNSCCCVELSVIVFAYILLLLFIDWQQYCNCNCTFVLLLLHCCFGCKQCHCLLGNDKSQWQSSEIWIDGLSITSIQLVIFASNINQTSFCLHLLCCIQHQPLYYLPPTRTVLLFCLHHQPPHYLLPPTTSPIFASTINRPIFASNINCTIFCFQHDLHFCLQHEPPFIFASNITWTAFLTPPSFLPPIWTVVLSFLPPTLT